MAVGKGSIKRAVKANSMAQKTENEPSVIELEPIVIEGMESESVESIVTEGKESEIVDTVIIPDSKVEIKNSVKQENHIKIGKELPHYLL